MRRSEYHNGKGLLFVETSTTNTYLCLRSDESKFTVGSDYEAIDFLLRPDIVQLIRNIFPMNLYKWDGHRIETHYYFVRVSKNLSDAAVYSKLYTISDVLYTNHNCAGEEITVYSDDINLGICTPSTHPMYAKPMNIVSTHPEHNSIWDDWESIQPQQSEPKLTDDEKEYLFWAADKGTWKGKDNY